ncbi:MAG: oligosaccharide flippase family protein, partial [Thermoguttaceae bacterium]
MIGCLPPTGTECAPTGASLATAQEVPLARKSARAAAASACSLFGRLGVQVVLARLLGSEGLGLIAYFLWLIETGVLLAGLGLPNSLTRYLAELLGRGESEQAAALARWIHLRYLSITAVGAAMLGVLYYRSASYAEWPSALPILVLLFLLRSLENLNLAHLAGRQRFDLLARIYLISSVLQFAGVVVGVLCFGMIGA